MSRCTNVFFVQAITLAILAHSAAIADAAGRAQTMFKYELNDLGVHYIQIYAWAPVNGTKEAVHLKLWLKRIIGDEKQQQPTGAARQPSFLLPSQQHHVVEGIGWAEDLATFKKYRCGRQDKQTPAWAKNTCRTSTLLPRTKMWRGTAASFNIRCVMDRLTGPAV